MKKKILLISFFIAIIIIIGSILLLNKNEKNDNNPNLVNKENNTYTIVNQASKIIGSCKRNIPEVSDEGLERYPQYGVELSDCDSLEKQAILAENSLLNAQEGYYDSMDKDGNLYLNGQSINRRLYKHTASIGMYYGDVLDTDEAVIKEITINPRKQGNYITGLYAPAGEVIKIEADIEETGEFEIHIGQASQLGNINNIWEAKGFNRMPVIVNKMKVCTNEAYVGSYLGGPIYVNTPKNNNEFTVRISGAVEYPTFILGQTTKEEYERTKKMSAPYFDLEVWDRCVRHSGPKREILDLSYEDLTLSAELWNKFSNVSRQIPNSANSNVGITFLYDPFVCAGAAVAIVGQSWCNLPPSWMKGSLSYDTFVNEGMWGTIHEFNHHFQRYGISPGDEVTNNAINILSYILYTNISSKRSIESNLTGWNRYLDPQISLSETIVNQKNNVVTNSLSLYTDIIHTFGVDLFIEACNYQNRNGGVDNWFKALCYTMKYDFTYYFEEVLKQNLSLDIKQEISNLNYPDFIPIASIYQVGRSYLNNNEIMYSNTVRPYEILANNEYILDFENNLIVPNGFNYQILDVSNPINGAIKKIDDLHYKYIPSNEELSGKFNVKVSVTNGTISQDIILQIELRQNKDLIKVTTYEYDNPIYNHINDAISSNLDGYSNKYSYGVKNQIVTGVKKGTITLVEGKYQILEDGDYQITYRGGRGSSNLYVSINSDSDYKRVGYIDINQNLFEINDMCNTKMFLKKGDIVYFKELLLSTSDNAKLELGYSLTDDVKDVKSVNNAIGVNGSFDPKRFLTNDLYPKKYTISEYEYNSDIEIDSYENYTPWDNNYLVENMIDNNSSTVGHSLNMINKDNPFIITFKLNNVCKANRIILTGHTRLDQLHLPYTFDLYLGNSLDEMKLINSYKEVSPTGRYLYIDFEIQEFKYFKLVVYDTNTHRYLAISDIKISYQIDGEIIGPDYIDYYGDFKYNNIKLSTFGHVYEGSGKIKFNFEGNGLMILSSNIDYSKIKINIDGNIEQLIIDKLNGIDYVYILNDLDNLNHTCTIEVLEGSFNIDSLIIAK